MRPVERSTSPILIAALACYIAVTLSYHLAGSAALLESILNADRHARKPMDIDPDSFRVTDLREEAAAAGVASGQTLETLNGEPYRGRAQWQNWRWRAKPGEELRLGLRDAAGRQWEAKVLLRRPDPAPFQRIAFGLIGVFAVPLVCLLLGYWVAFARPRDPNAWFILVLLTYPEAFITVPSDTWWPGLLPLRLFWHLTLEIITAAALLWFGLSFPERSRIDRRVPWLKWAVTGAQFALLTIAFAIEYAEWYDVRALPGRERIAEITNSCLRALGLTCLLIYVFATVDNLRSAATPDARRRMRLLVTGSGIGLGSILVIWAALPAFGIDPARTEWLLYLSAVLFLIFPLTLAYVVVVQRALDVRILLRMGTKYALARTTLAALQIAVAAAGVGFLLVPLFRHDKGALWDLVLALGLVAIARLVLARHGLSDRLERWLDRKFFREAYNAEQVLSELAEEARGYQEPHRLIETVSTRISEVLHVPRVAVLLRSGGQFRFERAIGLETDGALALAAGGATDQHFARNTAPAVMYRNGWDKWLRPADPERRVLEAIDAEVILPLPGREKLMGLMGLGPKQSEEAYTPSDLRLLQSVGAQTGLGLEITDLALLLAQEAAQRERMSREIEIAREVQERLFPQKMPARKGIDLAGRCRPALGVGGDYYDAMELEEERIGLAIGDVSGKGIGAALLMASLRASLRGMTAEGGLHLARMMTKLNGMVLESSTASRYATFFFAVYEPSTGRLCYVNAGHNAPTILRRCGSGNFETIRLEASGPVVGLLRQVAYTEQSIPLFAGDVLVGYTDGISEAMTEQDEEWGEERMIEAAQNAYGEDAPAILDSIMKAADEWTRGARQYDDMTLLIMRLT